MAIYVYLRASTKEQDPERSKETIINFLNSHNVKANDFFIDTASGTKLDRKQLNQLLSICIENDVIVVEQVDRLTRLNADDWRKLKSIIDSKGVRIVSLDLPTSYAGLKKELSSGANDINQHVNNLLLEILATTARKDYEDMKRRQAEGIAKAKAEGKYKGRVQSLETIKKCQQTIELIELYRSSGKRMSVLRASKMNGINHMTVTRYMESNKIKLDR